MSAIAKTAKSDQPDQRQQIRSQLEETRRAFHSLLDQLTNEDLNKPSLHFESHAQDIEATLISKGVQR
jgi:DNA-binding IscR family transcriptional regulator